MAVTGDPVGLTQRDFEANGCDECGHDHEDEALYLGANCHPGAGMEVSYRLGVLVVECKRCLKFVARVQVAP